MTVRFADIISASKDVPVVADRQDFVLRKRIPVWQVLLLLFSSTLLVTMVLSLLVEDIVLFAQILFVILFSLGLYTIVTIQRTRDLLLATEFQNSLFSSVISQSNKFCLVVKNDSSIAYMDRSFREMFPNFYKESRMAIDVLLEQGSVSKGERSNVFSALEKNVRNNVVFDITDSRRKVHRIMMSVEPIIRPKGFMLMRGHEFVEKRLLGPEIEKNSLPLVFNKDKASLFSYITDSMDVGAYMIDLVGHIRYANITLGQWLNFEADEVVDSSLLLRNIISQNGIDISVDDMKNFEGKVMLQRKIGGYIEATIKQKAMYDEQGKIIGYAAFVYRTENQNDDTKNVRNGNDKW